MDISRLKKVFAGVSASAVFVSQMGMAIAAYSDVPAGVWYEDAVQSFLDAGYLDASQTNFRGGDSANRAEFVKLVVELNGGILSTPPAVPSFDDVAPGQWYYGYFEEAGREGWVRGDGSCYGSTPCFARPASNINRAEASAIIVRAFGLESTGAAAQFVDNPSGQWYTEVIQTAADHCVLQGDDATSRVRPGDNMNRAEMVVMLHRVDMGLLYGQDCGEIAADPAVRRATATSATRLEVDFNTRLDQTAAQDASLYTITGPNGEIAVDSVSVVNQDLVEITTGSPLAVGVTYTLVVTDMVTVDGTVFSDSVTFSGYNPLPQGDGTLEVSVSASNPLGDTIPAGAFGVMMASVDLTAAGDDVLIENLVVLHEGFGNTSNIAGVYGVVNGERVTRKRSIDSSTTTATLRFQRPLLVRAGTTVTLHLGADFNTTADTGSEHRLTLELQNDFHSNAREVRGNFPIRGNTFRVAAVETGTLDVAYRTVTPSTVEVGDTGVRVGRFQLTANAKEDQTVYSITMENNGTAGDADIANLRLRRTDGTVVSNTVASLTNGFATFVLNPPFTILEGNNVTLDVIADIVGGSAKTVEMVFDEPSDIFAVGSLYGYGINGQLYGSQVSDPTGTSTPVTIEAGQFSINIDGPSRQAYTFDQDRAVLANIRMNTGEEDVDVERLFIAIRGNQSGGSGLGFADAIETVMSNVDIRNKATGRTIAGNPVASGSGALGSYRIFRFDDFIVRGQEEYELRVNFRSQSLNDGDQFSAYLCAASDSASPAVTCFANVFAGGSTSYGMRVRGLSTNDIITDVRPGATIAGLQHEVRASELRISVSDLISAENAVSNSKDIRLMRFQAVAGQAKDVLLTEFAIEEAAGDLINALNYSLWVDSTGDGNVDTLIRSGASPSGGTVTFNNITGGGWVIPKDTTVTFEVRADIQSTPLSNTLQIQFANNNLTSFQAEEVDGNSIDATGPAPVAATTYTILDQGTLDVRNVGVISRQLLGGTTADAALQLRFEAEYEDADVRQLIFTATGGTTLGSVRNIELYKLGEATLFATATTGSCPSGITGAMCVTMGSNQLVIPEDESVDIVARPRMKSLAEGGASSRGAGVQLALQGQNPEVHVETFGMQSGRKYTGADAPVIHPSSGQATSIVGNPHTAVFAKVTSITDDMGIIGTPLVPAGQAEIGAFRFTTAPSGNAGANRFVLSGIIFNVNATNVVLGTGDQTDPGDSDFILYKKGLQNQSAPCVANVATASGSSIRVRCSNLVASDVDTEIAQNSSATFVLSALVTAGSSGTATLQTSLANFASRGGNAALGPNFAFNTSHIAWVDNGAPNVANTFRWVEHAETTVNSVQFRTVN